MPYPPQFSSTLTYEHRYDLDEIDVFLEGDEVKQMFFSDIFWQESWKIILIFSKQLFFKIVLQKCLKMTSNLYITFYIYELQKSGSIKLNLFPIL